MYQKYLDHVALGIIVLFGTQGEHWDYYKTDPEWWELNLRLRLN